MKKVIWTMKKVIWTMKRFNFFFFEGVNFFSRDFIFKKTLFNDLIGYLNCSV